MTPTALERAIAGIPLRRSELLGRTIRQDSLETLGVSTQTMAEQALDSEAWEVAADLIEYFREEMWRIGEALHVWLEDIIAYRFSRTVTSYRPMAHGSTSEGAEARTLYRGLRGFNVSSGDHAGAILCCQRHDPEGAADATELMRLRWAAIHDALIAWIQELVSDLAADFGEDAVRESVEQTHERLWKPRYALWWVMSPLERLQLSVEGIRGHLCGSRRRGDVGLLEEPDRFVMILDPCGSCGILRRGDPESGRQPYNPRGNAEPHPWTWNRVGLSWYSVHSPIVMEYIWMRDGKPPMRPLEGCDTDGPCRWFIYKDQDTARPEHYSRMGFTPTSS